LKYAAAARTRRAVCRGGFFLPGGQTARKMRPSENQICLNAKFIRFIMSLNPVHILIYESQVEGHHVGNLQFIARSLLDAGFKITLAVDTRPEAFRRLQSQLNEFLKQVDVISANPIPGANRIDVVAECLMRSGADFVFLATFDEIASALLRHAACGLMPPKILRGRLAGIYMRPRFLAGCGLDFNLWIKSTGFTRLLRQGWFRQLLFLDPYISSQLKAKFPSAPSGFLPDPYPDNFITNRNSAMRYFKVPEGRRIFLFYGGAYRRKGLHLVAEAMLDLPTGHPAFLLCVGEQPKDTRITADLEKLSDRGHACLISRYVSTEEEKMVFAIADFVLLPYLHHFGNSGVLARAAGAGKPVIASDEQLVGRLVREHHLGLVFVTGKSSKLKAAIDQAATATEPQLQRWQSAAKVYAETCSLEAFRAALVSALAPPANFQSANPGFVGQP
jgi:glycosyltransferase involved in cell wall biosynthesis